MSIINYSPLSVLISVFVMSGILAHSVQAESLVARVGMSEHKQDLLSIERHTHIDIGTFSSGTRDLRSQAPSTRPRDEDDKNQTIKKPISGDGLGNYFSNSISL